MDNSPITPAGCRVRVASNNKLGIWRRRRRYLIGGVVNRPYKNWRDMEKEVSHRWGCKQILYQIGDMEEVSHR